MRVKDLDKRITKQELITMAEQHLEMEGTIERSLPTPKNVILGDSIRLLHLYSMNYCNLLIATNLCSKDAEHQTMSYALVYLCHLDECYKTINECDDFVGWATTYTLLGIL